MGAEGPDRTTWMVLGRKKVCGGQEAVHGNEGIALPPTSRVRRRRRREYEVSLAMSEVIIYKNFIPRFSDCKAFN